MEILERMETERFKVFGHLAEWFDEFRLYHRKDGKVVKLQDDLMDATRYAVRAGNRLSLLPQYSGALTPEPCRVLLLGRRAAG